MWTILFLVLALVVVFWVVSQKMPAHPPPEKREARMMALDLEPASSYAQKTNHYPATPVDMGTIPGFETPFRVNMFNSYMQ